MNNDRLQMIPKVNTKFTTCWNHAPQFGSTKGQWVAARVIELLGVLVAVAVIAAYIH